MATGAASPRRWTAVHAIALVWLGLLVGMSFIEAPLKFSVPGVTREVAFSLGLYSFSILNKIEIGLSLCLAGALYLHWSQQPARLTLLLVGGVFTVVLLQTAWLAPVLFDRIRIIVSGGQPPASSVHTIYVVAEGIKAVCLLVVGVWGRFESSLTGA